MATDLFQILAQDDQRLAALIHPQQLVYGGQKQSQRHVIYCLKEEMISEIQLTPDLKKIADIKGPYAMVNGLKPQFLYATPQFLIILTIEGVLQTIIFDSQTRQLQLKSQCTTDTIPHLMDCCCISRQIQVQRSIVMSEQNKLIQHKLKKTMIEKGYRVVFSGQAQNNKDFVISECFVNDQGDFCQTNHKYFKEQILQLFVSQENIYYMTSKSLFVLTETANNRICGLNKQSKVSLERYHQQPLTVEDGNFYKFPQFGRPIDDLISKLRQKQLNPELCIDQMQAELRIVNKITKTRQNFGSSMLAALDDRNNIVVVQIQESTGTILKQYIIPYIKDECVQILLHQHVFLLYQTIKSVNVYIISDNTKNPIQQIVGDINCLISSQTNTSINPIIFGLYGNQFAQLTINNIPKIISYLQTQLQFHDALCLVTQISDQQQKQDYLKQLTAQQGILQFKNCNYSDAYQLFLKSEVDPLAVLYLFCDPSFQLADPSITKQQLLVEQLQVNLPQDFIFPIVQTNQQNLSKDKYMQIVVGLRTYIYGWRQNLFDKEEYKQFDRVELFEQFSSLQQKQIQLIDEALVKSVILDINGVEITELSNLLKTQNLFISDQTAINLLHDKFPEILIQLFKQQRKYQLALNLLMQGQHANQALLPQTLTQVANFLLEVGLGTKTQPIDDQLKLIHRDYYQCVFLSNPAVFIDIFSLKPPNAHQLDIIIGIQFLDSMNDDISMNVYKPDGSVKRVLNMTEIKCLCIQNAIDAGNYYTKDLEAIYQKLMGYYIQIITFEVSQLLKSLQQKQSYVDMFKILDNVLDYKRIIKNLCIDENDIYDSDKQQNINYIDVVQEIESELLSYEFVVEQFVGENESIIYKERALTEQIGGIVGEYRKKLNKVVKKLDGNIDYQKFINLLPEKQFTEERAVLWCKRYNFEKALQLIALGLGRPLLAEAICDFVYNDSLQVSIENRQMDIYLILLKVYLSSASQPFLRAAYTLIISKYDKMPPTDVLEMLPRQQVKLEDISIYLRIILSQYKLQQLDYKLLEVVNVGQLGFLNNQIVKYQSAETSQTRSQKCPICFEIYKKDVIIIGNGRMVCLRCWQTNQQQCENLMKLRPTRAFRCFTDVFD